MASVGKMSAPTEESEDDNEEVDTSFDVLYRYQAERHAEGESVLYEVNIKKATVFAKPSNKSDMLGKLTYGMQVDTFAWDDSKMWRQVCCELKPRSRFLIG